MKLARVDRQSLEPALDLRPLLPHRFADSRHVAAVLPALALGCSELIGLESGSEGNVDAAVPVDGSQKSLVDDARVRDESPGDIENSADDRQEGSLPEVDAGVDAAPVPGSPTSCLEVLRQSPDAGSGVYPLAVNGALIEAYCDMVMDDGGWTAFYAFPLATSEVQAHFEDLDAVGMPRDTCSSPAMACLRHVPSVSLSQTSFAASCGADALRFSATPAIVAYFALAIPSAWTSLQGVVAIAGHPTLSFASEIYLGDPRPSLEGWVITANDVSPNATPHTFASGFTATGPEYWSFCNGVDFNDAGAGTPLVRLYYR